MSISTTYWRVLIAALQLYAWAYIGELPRAGVQRFSNHGPRGWLARQINPPVQRADAVQHNISELVAPLAAGVSLAHRVGVDAGLTAALTVAFLSLQSAYRACCVAGWASLRSHLWAAAVVPDVALNTQAAWRVDASPLPQARQ